MYTFKTGIYIVLIFFLIQPYKRIVPCAQGALSRHDISWLHNKVCALGNEHCRVSIKKHLLYGVKRKLIERREIATLPFQRPQQNNQQATINLLTTTVTLPVAVVEEANFDMFMALIQQGVNPLRRVALSTLTNRRRKISAIDALIELAIKNEDPNGKHVGMFIKVFEWAKDYSNLAREYRQATSGLADTDTFIPRDHRYIIQAFIGGDCAHERQIATLIMERLRGLDAHGNTLLDRLVAEIGSNAIPVNVYLHTHEAFAHKLKKYLLSNDIYLNTQSSLFNVNLLFFSIFPLVRLLIAAYSVTSLRSSVKTLKCLFLDPLKESSWSASVISLAPVVCVQSLQLTGHSSSLSNCLGIVADSFINRYYFNHVAPWRRLWYIVYFPNPLLNFYKFLSEVRSLHENLMRLMRLLVHGIQEHRIAYQRGITDFWGQKRDVSILEEIGGLA